MMRTARNPGFSCWRWQAGGFLALIHMIVLPIWMLIASLRYWEVNRRMLAVTGLLFSILAPVCMVLMLSCWSVSG